MRNEYEERFLEAVRQLLKLSRAGEIPALWVDAGVIRIPWPRQQHGPQTFRILTLDQAERILAGETVEAVFKPPRRVHRPQPVPARPDHWRIRRASYLHHRFG